MENVWGLALYDEDVDIEGKRAIIQCIKNSKESEKKLKSTPNSSEISR